MSTPSPNGIQAARETVAEAQTLVAAPPLVVNADEHVPQIVAVPFVEWRIVAEDEDGVQIERRELVRRRTARIYNFVPSEVFDAFMDVMEKVQERERQKSPEGKAPSRKEAVERLFDRDYMDLQRRFVLAIWQITEPKMDLERFRLGLGEDQIVQLFRAFFLPFLQRLKL